MAWTRWLAASNIARAAVVVLAVFSFWFNLLGAFYYPCGFNTIPNEINAHPERLWDVRDGELARCTSKMGARLQSHWR